MELTFFQTMQSSFMPINEPNFGSEYILDYGDYIEIRSFGTLKKVFNEEIKRDGTITIEGIGSISLAGLDYKEASQLIKNLFMNAYIGAEIIVNLKDIRDIKVLITGNVSYPGMYTLSGNSNILQAINIAGGVKENGSLREISLIRNGKVFQTIDLYQALIFGDLNNIPSLRSGDSINIKPALKLVRAGSGFVNQAIFELKENESFFDLLKYAGGIQRSSESDNFSIIRYQGDRFKNMKLTYKELADNIVKHNDTINLSVEKFGTVSISGSIKNPGIYSISSNDRLSDIIKRAGGYKKSAYIFGSALYRENTKILEKKYADDAYDNLIKYLASDPKILNSQGASFLPLILSEIKNFKPSGRVSAEFRLERLSDDKTKDIYLSDKDKIFIPKFNSSVFIFGEVSNPGAVTFADGEQVNYYINNSGGITEYASDEYIYIVSPDGLTQKIKQNRLSKFIDSGYEIYPGSVVYVPRKIGKIQGLDFYTAVAPIFSSLALSIASLNAIND